MDKGELKMTREQFGRGLQLLNSVLSEKNQIIGSSIDTYFLILEKYKGKSYINAIMKILTNEDLRYGAPSPSMIIDYIKREERNSSKALEVLDRIKFDILLYPERPKYKKHILELIEQSGGFEVLRNGSEKGLKDFESKFVEGFSLVDSGNLLEGVKDLIK